MWFVTRANLSFVLSSRKSMSAACALEAFTMKFFQTVLSRLRQVNGWVLPSGTGFLLAASLCLLQPVPGSVCYAQNTNATIRGQVLDPTGALVPNASVAIVNQQTGVVVFQGESDSAGVFVAPQVIPGTYKVTVTAPGLKQAVVNNLVATVAQTASITVNLELGVSTETVTVESHGEQLDSATSDISTLIAPTEVQNLPLNGRATENLLSLIPGVAHGGAGDTPSTSQLSINGSRTLNTEVLLNGVSTIIASTGTPLTLPSPDGVDSFRVLTNNAPAEYGRTSGAVISVNTISGTNTYHGNAYFLLRNEAFDANTFFHKATLVNGAVLPRSRDRFFQAGGSFGGPVRIPHLYNGKDHTFFFVNFDRTIQPTPSTVTETVPTQAQRTGNLSNASAPTDANGIARKAQLIYQPTGTASPAFGGNQVGPIDPAAAKILALLPLPNTPGTYDAVNNRYTGNWVSLQNLTGHTNKIVARLDEAATSKDRISINLYRYTTSTPNPITYNSELLNTTWDCTCNNAWLPSVDYTRIWTPTLVMDLNMGFFRNVVLRNPPGTGLGAGQQLGIASLPLDETPQISASASAQDAASNSFGFSNIGADTNTNQINITNTYTPFGTVTKTVGPHTLRIGASLRKNEFNSYNPATVPQGQFVFDGSTTNHGAAGNPNTQIADFLLGKVKTAQYEQPQPETGRRNYNYGIFLQDDWHATQRLTLNLGIRYEYESPLTIANNIYSRIDPATGILLVAGQNATRSLNVSTPKADVSPRIGFAYAVDNKTVIRGAFGTFYGTIFQNLGGQLAYPGYDNTISYNNLGTAIAQPFSLSQGIPLAAPPNLNNPGSSLATSSAANPYTVGISFNNQNKMSLIQQYNVGIQRRLPLSLTLEVNYVGNHGLHLPLVLGENQVPLASVPAVTLANTSLATQNSLQFPNLKAFSTTDNVGGSNYNSLQVTVRREFNTQLAILSNFTWAKSMDDGSTIYNFSAPNGSANSQYALDNPNRIKDIAPSNLDIRDIFNIALIYTTRGPWWLRGFHISPVFFGHTGIPVNIVQSNEIPGASQRPNGNPQLVRLAHPMLNGASLQYYDSATDPAFPLTASGPVYNTINGVRTQIVPTGFGNVSRDSNRAPGEADLDASVSKDFQIFARLKFQFRVDAFNVINHTNFSAPSGSLTVTADPVIVTNATFATSSGFGKITGTQPNRILQLSSRFFF
jgi:hypothetical protein